MSLNRFGGGTLILDVTGMSLDCFSGDSRNPLNEISGTLKRKTKNRGYQTLGKRKQTQISHTWEEKANIDVRHLEVKQ